LTLAGAVTERKKVDPFDAAETLRLFTFDDEADRTLDQLPQPVGWSRRRGPLFPEYVEAYIDPINAPNDYSGRRSLRFTLNGGQATYYSPVVRIDADHSYVLEAWIRTEGIVHDAAMVSLSFLNYKTQRIQRHLSTGVMGTHEGFQRVRIGPLTPKPDFKFVVIGCHLMAGKKMDIRGDAWFDDIRLATLPLVDLTTVGNRHYFVEGEPIVIEAKVRGREDDRKHQLRLELETADTTSEKGKILRRNILQKEADDEELNKVGTHSYLWPLTEGGSEGTPLPNGYYRVRATFERGDESILEKETTFAVMQRASKSGRGIFGWSLSEGGGEMEIPELADVAAQGGVNLIKYPLWSAGDSDDSRSTTDIALLMERISRRDIELIGLLNDPPKSLLDKFAQNLGGAGISKIFTMPDDFWHPSLESVIANYSFRVRHWQLGGESDKSFVGMKSLPNIVASIKQEFDRVGRDVQIGVHWDWNHPLPSSKDLPSSFLSLSTERDPENPTPGDEVLGAHLQQTKDVGIPRWVLLKPLSTEHSLQERASDLVRRMMTAQLGKADAIFAYNPFDPEFGLLSPDGSPTELFLPWRTTALALQGATFLGVFNLPGGSKNVVFSKPDEVLMVVWNDHPTEEKLYLGEEVMITDLFGRTHPAPEEDVTENARSNQGLERAWKKQIISTGPVPVIVRGCSGPVARWRLAVQYKHKRIPSMYGEHSESILGQNTFDQGVSVVAKLNFNDKWVIDQNKAPIQLAPGEKFQLPVELSFPNGASIGQFDTSIDFEVQAERGYRFTVYRPYELGLGHVTLDVKSHLENRNGRRILIVEQIVTNRTEPLEILNFNCTLRVPGRKRQKRTVIKLGHGTDNKVYWVPNADELIGKTVILGVAQIDGKRWLWKDFTVTENPPPDKKQGQDKTEINPIPANTDLTQ